MIENMAVIVPWGTDHGPREKVWNFLKQQYEHQDHWPVKVDLIVAGDPLFGTPHPDALEPPPRADESLCTHPFSVARAINRAVRLAPAEYDAFTLLGADHVPNMHVIAYAFEQLQRYRWLPLYRRIGYADQKSTEQVIAGMSSLDDIKWSFYTLDCPGVLAVRRELFELIGGMDDRYEGAGYEDNDLVNSLKGNAEPGSPSHEPLFELWHPTDHRVYTGTPNDTLYKEKWGK